MPMTEETREYYRSRYAARCQDEAYRQKVREYARTALAKKKQRLLDAGVVTQPRGRPRKYISIVESVTTTDTAHDQ